jgi:hypothetical protein
MKQFGITVYEGSEGTETQLRYDIMEGGSVVSTGDIKQSRVLEINDHQQLLLTPIVPLQPVAKSNG